MSANFQAVYYRDATGRQPVLGFIKELSEPAQESIDEMIDLLNGLSDRQPHLPHPYSSQVKGELRELRCHYGRRHFRILYRRSERLIVLLHAFEKKGARVPAREIEAAERRFADFKRRMDQEPRQPPRAIGHDAP